MHKTVDDKIDQWFEDRGIVANGKTMSQAIKTLEETTELIDAINTNNLLEIVDAVGDIYVTLRGVCVVEGIDLTECAELAYNEIKDRKGHLRADGTFVKEHDRLPEKLMSDDSYTPHPGPLDGKKFTQRQFDEVADKVDEAFMQHTEAMEDSRSKAEQDTYKHTKEYYDTERNKSTNDNIYVKDKETGRNKQMSAKEYWDSLPDTVASKDIPTRAVWRTDPNDPKIIPFKEDSKDVD